MNAKHRSRQQFPEFSVNRDVFDPRVATATGRFARISGFAILSGLSSHRFLMHVPTGETEISQYTWDD
jgi:hypothetical protein